MSRTGYSSLFGLIVKNKSTSEIEQPVRIKMSKMQEQELCDSLVHQYLIENGHYKTAQLLQEERKRFYTLNFNEVMKISESFSYMISEYVKTDAMTNTLVYDYFKSHENFEVRKMSQELQGLVHIETNENYTSVSEVINHFLTPNKILKPKKLLRQVHISLIRKHNCDEKAQNKAEEMAKDKAEEMTKNKAEEMAKNKVEEVTKNKAKDKAKKEAEEMAKNETEEKAKKAADEISEVGSILRKGMKFKYPEEYSIFMKAKRKAGLKAKNKRWKAKKKTEMKAKKEMEIKAKHEAELKAKNEAEEKAKCEAELKVKNMAEKMATKKAGNEIYEVGSILRKGMKFKCPEEYSIFMNTKSKIATKKAKVKAKKEMEIKTKHEAELKAINEAEEMATEWAEMKSKKEIEIKAKNEAELKDKSEAEKTAKKKADIKAKKEIFLFFKKKSNFFEKFSAKNEDEEMAKKKAEMKVKNELEEKAKHEAELKAKNEAEVMAKKKAEIKAKKFDQVESELEAMFAGTLSLFLFELPVFIILVFCHVVLTPFLNFPFSD